MLPPARRIVKVSATGHTFYGWDGDILAFETRDSGAVHYLFEPGSFVPLAQVHTDPIQGARVPAWGAHTPYDPTQDPLRQAPPTPSAPRAVFYYHTDHLGTPQLLTDEEGERALEMECRIPDDYIDFKRHPLFMAREAMAEFVAELKASRKDAT